MLKISDISKLEELDSQNLQAVEGGINYKGASYKSGYKKIKAQSEDVLISKLSPALMYEWWLA